LSATRAFGSVLYVRTTFAGTPPQRFNRWAAHSCEIEYLFHRSDSGSSAPGDPCIDFFPQTGPV